VSISVFVGVRDTLYMRMSMGLLDSPMSVVDGQLFPSMKNTAFLMLKRSRLHATNEVAR